MSMWLSVVGMLGVFFFFIDYRGWGDFCSASFYKLISKTCDIIFWLLSEIQIMKKKEKREGGLV